MSYLPTPAEVLSFWRSKKTARHDAVATYLQTVAGEAAALASQWNAYAAAIESELEKPSVSESVAILRLENLGVISFPNPSYSRVVLHYRNLSKAIGDLISQDVHEEAAHALGGVIKARMEVKDLLVRACQILRDDGALPVETAAMARVALEALHQEAAALDVLAKTYRVRG
jgi:hypothetical protein